MLFSLALGCTFALSVLAVPAQAQFIPPNCGSITTNNNAYQDGAGSNRVRGIVRTTRDITPCVIDLQTEGWVGGAGGAHTGTGTYAASVDFSVPTPTFSTYTVNGKHWAIMFSFAWHYMGPTASQVTLTPPQGGEGGEEDLPCDTDPAWPGCNSPIVVDIANNGYRLTSVEDGVQFDIDADGITEQVAWTRADSDDAFLALDRNGNGLIDNGSELFGNHTPTYAFITDATTPKAANGFEALKYLQHQSYGVSMLDDRIDERDAVFASLVFWRDVNHNGISEEGELVPASETGLTAMSTDYRESKRVDRHGNEFRLRARSFWSDGTRQPVFDVWLRTQYTAPAGMAPSQ